MNQREKRLSIATVVILGGGFLFSQVVDPGLKRYQEQQDQQELVESALERERMLSSRIGTLIKRRQELEATLAPAEGESLLPWLMGHIRELAQEAGFKPSSLRFVSAQALDGPGKDEGPFVELKLELRVKTSPKELQEFLIRLAASPRHLRVRALSMTPDKKGDQVETTILLLALAPREAVRGLGGEAQ